MKTSQIVAKAVVRFFFLALVLATIPLFQADGDKLHHLYIVANNKWLFFFPILLMVAFLYFFIRCNMKKYTETEMNWVLVVNTIVLMAYGATIFIRVYELIK